MKQTHEQVSRKLWNIFTVLATMTVGSGLVCCCGSVVPEQILQSATIVLPCGTLGTIGTMLAITNHEVKRLDRMYRR